MTDHAAVRVLRCLAAVASGAVTAACGSGFPFQDSADDLRELAASTTEVNIRGLPATAVPELGRLASLEFIDLCGGWRARRLTMDAEGMEALARLRLPNLRAVSVCHSDRIDDAWLCALGSVPTLDRVWLERCSGFSPEGLRALLKSGITGLGLGGCKQIDDSWVPALTSQPNLRHLDVSGTGVSEEGFARIRECLPVCVVQAYPELEEP